MERFWSGLFQLLRRALFFRIIKPWEAAVVTFCGRHVKTHQTNKGKFILLVPFLSDVDVLEVTEQVPDIRCGTAITSDGIDLAIGAGISYEIRNAKQLFHNVQDVDKSLRTVVLGTIQEYVAKHTFDQCVKEQKDFVAKVEKALSDHSRKREWGLRIVKVWITDVGRKYTRIITDSEGETYVPYGDEE